MKRLFIILLMLIAINTNAQWVQMNGPDRGFIHCFASSGSDIFAGSYGGGVFRSTNNGDNWFSSNNGLTNPDITSLLLTDSNLLAGTLINGVFRSTDYGDNWSEVNNGLSNLNIKVLYSIKNYVFAGTSSGIFLSTNKGTNWVACGLANKTVKSIISFDSTLFVGTYGNGIFYSTDYGVNWTAINIGLTNMYVTSLVIIDNYFFAATQGGVYRSINAGAYWVYIGLTAEYQLTVKEKNLFAGGWNSGVRKSTNYGLNWTTINTGLIYHSINTIYSNKTNLFLGTEFGVHISSNNGANWSVNNDGITNELVISLTAIGPYIFAGTESNGLFKSSDNGLNWETCGLEGKSIFALVSSSSNIFAGTFLDGGIFLSTNYGESWNAVNNGLTNQVIFSLVIKEGNIFAGTEVGVFRSTNNGQNWTLVNNGITYYEIFAMAAGRTDIFAGSKTSQGGIFRSSDNGQNWIQINIGLTNRMIRSILVSGTNIYAGTYDGVFFSSNNGDNWVHIGLANQTVYALIKIGSDILAGSNKGAYLFNYDSKTWLDRNQGFSIAPGVCCLLNTYNNVIAGTFFQSVWRRSIFSIIGINTISETIPNTISLSQNYPNPFNSTSNLIFQIASTGDVKLVVYDIQGREVKILVNERLQPGTYEAAFDASTLNSGVYFYKLITGTFSETKKMLLIK